MTLTISDLIVNKPAPVYVYPQDPVHDAWDRMILHDYSQLPVVDSSMHPRGLISTESILLALNSFGASSFGSLPAHAAMVPCHLFRETDDFYQFMKQVLEATAVLIVDASGKLKNIVTTYDTTSYLREQAEDMLIVEDIETTIKAFIVAAVLTPKSWTRKW